MAETRLTNIITPEVFTDYTMENWTERNRFFTSGAVINSPELARLLNGGGKNFNAPFWQSLSGDSDIPVENSAQDVNNITASKIQIRRQMRTKAFGANALTSIESGSKALDVFAKDVVDYWNGQYNKAIISSAVGVLADNVANDSGDLINDQSTVAFDRDMIFDTMNLLGENGIIGRNDSTDFSMIIVHSKIYSSMQKMGLIDTTFTVATETAKAIPIYSFYGLEVIVDDKMTVDTGVYTSILVKNGAFQFGTSVAGFEPTSFERIEGKGFGIDEIYTRRVFGVAPVGFSWTDTTVAGTSPTFAEMELAVNWDRAYAKENSKMVFLNSLA